MVNILIILKFAIKEETDKPNLKQIVKCYNSNLPSVFLFLGKHISMDWKNFLAKMRLTICFM